MFYSLPKIEQCTCHVCFDLIKYCKSICVEYCENVEPVEYGVTPVEKIPIVIVE